MATCDICGPALKAPEIVSAEGADLDTLWDTQVKDWADREKSEYGSAIVLKEFVGDVLRLELLLSVVPTVDEETSSLSSRSERTTDNIMGLEFYTTTDIPSPWKGITDARHLPKNPYSEQRWSLVREWITQCNNDHLNCQTSSSQFYSPKRLLDVTRISAEIPAAIDLVRLVENADTCQNYICLSYCWGDYIPFMAVTSTLASLKNGIPLLSLAKTFQDAIYVTRALGIKYLWIDALCILQDDDQDWDQQSSEMANIYGHAYLTIAASSAQNPTVEFLNLASGDPHKLYETHGTTPMGEGYSIFARVARHQHGVDVTTDEYGSQPLLWRAWAYQEHMLSPRVLQFGSQEMYWECSGAKFCECRTRYEILDRRTLGHRRNPKEDLQDALSNCVNNPDMMVAVWHGIIQKYSGRWLTFEKDKLPALFGVARLIEQRTKSRYYAGAWGHSIIPDLHWRVRHHFRPNPEQYLAPSWSWASVGNEVEFFGSRPAKHTNLIQKATYPLKTPGVSES